MALDTNLEVTNEIAKITLSGELDASTAGEFKSVVEKAAEENPKRIQRLPLRLDEIHVSLCSWLSLHP